MKLVQLDTLPTDEQIGIKHAVLANIRTVVDGAANTVNTTLDEALDAIGNLLAIEVEKRAAAKAESAPTYGQTALKPEGKPARKVKPKAGPKVRIGVCEQCRAEFQWTKRGRIPKFCGRPTCKPVDASHRGSRPAAPRPRD